jgi:hypothetical protein
MAIILHYDIAITLNMTGEENNPALKVHIAMTIFVKVPKHNFDPLKIASELMVA